MLGHFGNTMIVINNEEIVKIISANQNGTIPDRANDVNPKIIVFALTFISNILNSALLLTAFGPFAECIKLIFLKALFDISVLSFYSFTCATKVVL